jgi:hypothetical protein
MGKRAPHEEHLHAPNKRSSGWLKKGKEEVNNNELRVAG